MRDDHQASWFALFVKPRHEKFVAQLLRQKGYEEFLPLYEVRRRWSDRYKTLLLPLFPCYAFCRFDLNRRLAVLRTPGVKKIVGWGRTPAPVEQAEIEQIRRIVDSKLRAEPCGYLAEGERVRIEAGPLRGVEGFIEQQRGAERLVVSVTLLQRSVAVEIDPGWAAPLRASQAASA